MASSNDSIRQVPHVRLPVHKRIDSKDEPDDTTAGAEVDAIQTLAQTRAQATTRLATRPLNSADLINEIDKLLKANPIGYTKVDKYVPENDLKSLLTVDVITGVLGLDPDQELVQYILNKAQKIFAILHVVFEHSPERGTVAIRAFHKAKFTDKMLLDGTFQCKSNCEVTLKHCPHLFPSPMPWTTNNSKDQFWQLRWQFFVPIFDQAVFQYEFHQQRMLPWRGRVSNNTISSGNFGEIECLRLIAEHQTLLPALNDGTILVARKTLKKMDDVLNYNVREEWLREAKAHKELNGRNAHLVRAIAAYELVDDAKHRTYHLILEWADGGNLYSFWKVNAKPQLDSDAQASRNRVRDLLEQFKGLAEALECMHFGVPTSISRRSSVQETEPLLPQSSPAVTTEAPSMPMINVQDHDERFHRSSHRTEGGASGAIDTSTSGLTVPVGIVRRDTSMAEENWRHGDIKPENILRFTSEQSDSVPHNTTVPNGHDHHPDARLGTLKLADLGRAQQHKLKTALRNTIEKERWRTRWYEPPDLSLDLQQQAHGKISRLFDIWSLGCVFFEGSLWVLYGSSAIERFQATNSMDTEHFIGTPYWRKAGPSEYRVTGAASAWMDHVIKDGEKYSPAIADLVKLVKNRLLVVDLPPDSESYTLGCRTHAQDMRQELCRILSNAEDEETYLYSGPQEYNAQPPSQDVVTSSDPSSMRPAFLSPSSALKQLQNMSSSRQNKPPPSQATRIASEWDYTDDTNDEWQFIDDHAFAKSLIDRNQIPYEDDGLCESCVDIDVQSKELVIRGANILAKMGKCVLCELMYKAFKKAKLEDRQEIRLIKVADSFVAREPNGVEIKILRMCRADDFDNQTLGIPFGLPDLYEGAHEPKASPLMKLANRWLDVCDRDHDKTCGTRRDRSQLPKRLLDVKSRTTKIINSSSLGPNTNDIRYIAFSHKWGKMPEEAKTNAVNLPTRMKEGMQPDELPQSFKDAIAVTKALGCKYLWIDCLCINQGKNDGDFAQQAGSMQTVFSNAYCVIAAASAHGATAGFWARDVELNPVFSVRKGEAFISAVTNDFSRDVLESPLSQRGWVLQEHALAYRTIFFTESQMYWECGDGVRCETLRKLKHDVAGLLGDSDFPSKTVQPESTRGTQIKLWTRLFSQYSSLAFTYPEDRSVAIEGLMSRLTTAFRTETVHGVFKSFWGRCLLWRRPQNGASLEKILPGEHAQQVPPTWSWMAVKGTISFLQPEGGEVDWNDSVIIQFSNPANEAIIADEPQSSSLHPVAQPWRVTSNRTPRDVIQAPAFSLTAAAAQSFGEERLYFDGEVERANGEVGCVIICTSKKDKTDCHVLLIARTSESSTYERVGVGRFSVACIDRSSEIRATVI